MIHLYATIEPRIENSVDHLHSAICVQVISVHKAMSIRIMETRSYLSTTTVQCRNHKQSTSQRRLRGVSHQHKSIKQHTNSFRSLIHPTEGRVGYWQMLCTHLLTSTQPDSRRPHSDSNTPCCPNVDINLCRASFTLQSSRKPCTA